MSFSYTSSPRYPSIVQSCSSIKFDGDCPSHKCGSYQSYDDSTSSEFPYPHEEPIKKICFKKVKSFLQQPSTITGENLFDHLVELIERIIDERPANVIDYFEQFSRDVRANKLQPSERLSAKPYHNPQFLNMAMAFLRPFQLPFSISNEEDLVEEQTEAVEESQVSSYQSTDMPFPRAHHFITQDENILQYQHLWSFCGLGFQIDEMFQLSWAVQKIQGHPGITNARFWGRIYGICGSYYIVEALLAKSEAEIRFKSMSALLLGEMVAFINRRDKPVSLLDIESDLLPGYSWKDYSIEDLRRMQCVVTPVPQRRFQEKFEIPPEPVGKGLNRRTYFVTTALNKEWQELPIVTPAQIKGSKKVRQFFTGDLDAPIASHPRFPGTEKHYLRAMISRITAGTYIAPRGYYRKMTKEEEKLAAGEESDEGEEEEEDLESEGGGKYFDNDTPLIRDSNYKPKTLKQLGHLSIWLHVRPNIFNQGRVLYINEKRAIEELEHKAFLRMKRLKILEERGDEYEFEEEDEEEEEAKGSDEDAEEEDYNKRKEIPPSDLGPDLFTPCSADRNKLHIPSWTSCCNSLHNKTNRMIMMRSNLWPGAYSFAFEKFCDSIYIGWGMKYVPRCFSLEDVPPTQDIGHPDVVYESTDPTPEIEEKWRQYYLVKEKLLTAEEMMSNISVEFDADDEEDETV